MTANEVQMVVTEVLRQLGFASGEISDRQARKVFGKPFAEAVAAGKIRPVRIGTGKTATKHYRITDILAEQSRSYETARLIYKPTNTTKK